VPTARQRIALVSLAFWRGAMRASGLIPPLSTIWPTPVYTPVYTHFDHAIDVPELARSHDTMAYGSDSLMRLMGLYGLGDRAVEIQPHHPYQLGPFTVRFIPSLHSKLLLGYKVPIDGALTCDHLDPQIVVANHYDDFFRPLSAPMGFSTNVNLAALPDEIREVSRNIGVAALPLMTTPTP
jgi:L-ascorbate metabolism protein UlaG (beta-lactamase superfamily)